MAEELDPSLDQPESRLGPPVPETVSLAWLFHNVPWRFWVVCFSALVAVFIAGIEVAQIGWVRDLVWKNEPRIISAKSPVPAEPERSKGGESSPDPTATPGRNEVLRESSARELADYFATIVPLQRKPLYESSYLGRRVSWKGHVGKVSDNGSEYDVYVWDRATPPEVDALMALSLSRDQRLVVEQLREGDHVAFEGVLKSFDLWRTFQIQVDHLSLLPPEKPAPTVTPKRSH